MLSPPNTRPARRPLLETARRGAVAGLTGSIVQAGVGYLIDRALLPRGHNNNIAPRLSARFFQRTGRAPQPVRDWLFGAIFHELYGVGWGVLQALAADRLRIPPPFLAPPLTGLIYLFAFSRFGVGTLTGTERHPDHRHRGKQASLLAVAAVFALATSLVLYGYEQQNARRSGEVAQQF